jgi:hypothetical protein
LLAITLCVTAGIGVAAKTGSPHDGDPPATVTVTTTRTVTSFYRGVSAPQWAAKFGTMRHLAYERLKAERRARRTLLASPTVAEAISLAGATYGFADTLWRKARCESTLDPNAKNGSEASGTFPIPPVDVGVDAVRAVLGLLPVRERPRGRVDAQAWPRLRMGRAGDCVLRAAPHPAAPRSATSSTARRVRSARARRTSRRSNAAECYRARMRDAAYWLRRTCACGATKHRGRRLAATRASSRGSGRSGCSRDTVGLASQAEYGDVLREPPEAAETAVRRRLRPTDPGEQRHVPRLRPIAVRRADGAASWPADRCR